MSKLEKIVTALENPLSAVNDIVFQYKWAIMCIHVMQSQL